MLASNKKNLNFFERISRGQRIGNKGLTDPYFKMTDLNENMTELDVNRGRMPAKPKILLIEQHLPIAMSLVALLTQAGCDVEVATSARSAMQVAPVREFDLIALDPDLPDIGGFETFLRLQQIPNLAGIPIVFIARHSDDASWRGSLELGAADYIERPFGGSAFVRRMLSHIKGRTQPDPVAARIS